MIRETYQNIVNHIDVRQNVSKLRQELKEEANRNAFLYLLGGDYHTLLDLLCDEDAKIRKNTAMLIGALGVQELLPSLYEAYKNETQKFVKSSYLNAMKEYDFRNYLPELKLRLDELIKTKVTEEDKKHVNEEIRILSELITMTEGVKAHTFTGFHVPSRLVLLTNRNHISMLKEQLNAYKTKEFGAGLIVDTDNLDDILSLRTYSELLFMVDKSRKQPSDTSAYTTTAPSDVEGIADTIINSGLLEFLKKRHQGKEPFYFRIELKSKMELDKKSVMLKKLSTAIEQLSNRSLINSTSYYEVELRLIERKDGGYYILIKLFTIKDERFSYRTESLATSIRPVNAALMMELIKPYLKEQAKVLDPFCGVGTMLIERHKCLECNTMYGLDLFGEAVRKAKINTEAAHQIIHYINRDFFDFKHEYLFDEIVTNLPLAIGRKGEEEIATLYQGFFRKAKEHLAEDGKLFLYSHNKEEVLLLTRTNGYRIRKEFEISKKEGTYVFVIEQK